MATKKMKVCICDQCGHQWLPTNQKELPKRCSSCKSMRWNQGQKKAA